jgi:hypothetical protein
MHPDGRPFKVIVVMQWSQEWCGMYCSTYIWCLPFVTFKVLLYLFYWSWFISRTAPSSFIVEDVPKKVLLLQHDVHVWPIWTSFPTLQRHSGFNNSTWDGKDTDLCVLNFCYWTCGWVVSIPLYFWSPRFRSQPRDQMYWLRFFWFSVMLPGKCLHVSLNYVMAASFHVFSNLLFIN